MDADIIIKNGMILTLDESFTLHAKADLAIAGSKIVEIAPQTKFKAKKSIEARGKLVIPGLINTHTHAAMVMMRGLADDLPLEKWWRGFIFPIENKLVDGEFVKVGVSLAAVEMIKSGTTTFSDMYFFEDEAAQVCQQIGMRAWLGEGLMDAATPNCKSPEDSLRYTEKLYEKWRSDQLISITVAPHAPYSCAPAVLKKAQVLAKKYDMLIHIHVSETAKEIVDVENLEKIGFLSERIMAAHCVHLTKRGMRILKKRRVKVADCPESNMKLASGCAPIVELLAMGVTVGLGTDGAASNNNLDMFDEMDAVAKLHKVVSGNPSVMKAEDVLRLATTEGAQVLQRPDLGSLAVGQTADIIILDLQKPHLTPLYNIYSNLVYSAGGSEVDSVIINGRLIMENRRLLTIDENEVLDRANHLAKKIKAGAAHG